MILVDSSVWVTALRNGKSAAARHLAELLDHDEVCLAIPVRLELLLGASAAVRPRLANALAALPVLYPTEGSWKTIESWAEVAGARRERFGFADLLIGVLAAEAKAPVWSLDRDFARMERLGLLKLHDPA
jgi:predicted nucleic acid-binding protein